MRGTWRPDSNLSKLSEGAYELACAMCESKSPTFTADQIIADVYDVYKEHLNRNNVTALKAHLSEERKEREDKAIQRKAIAEGIAKRMGLDSEGQHAIQQMLQVAVLANDTDLSKVDPDKLAALLIRQQKNDLMQRKLDLQEERLRLENERLKIELDRIQRELEREKKADEEKRKRMEEAASNASKVATAEDAKQVVLEAIEQVWGLS
jgi:hypothetical protein